MEVAVENNTTYVKPSDPTKFNNTVCHFPTILTNPRFGNKVRQGVLSTKLYDVSKDFPEKSHNSLSTYDDIESYLRQSIEVYNLDTFDLTSKMRNRGYERPCVLNLASERRAGGGWRYGSNAQEEALFYTSTYGMSNEMSNSTINPEWVPNADRGWDYPLDKYHAVYSPDVLVFKDHPNAKKIMPEDEWFFTDCIAMPGLRCPEHLPNGDYKPEDYEVMKKKIRGIFEITIANNNDVLVLGALGCGVFKNNPTNVANLFKKVIEDGKYDLKLKIVFAVLCFKDTTNYDVFHNTLDTVYTRIMERKNQ